MNQESTIKVNIAVKLIKSGLKYDLKAVTHKMDEICSKRSKFTKIMHFHQISINS